jgi:hypothetical protein
MSRALKNTPMHKIQIRTPLLIKLEKRTLPSFQQWGQFEFCKNPSAGPRQRQLNLARPFKAG